jgi:phosphate uptake regulator
MANELKISKTQLDKKDLDKVIDRSFKTFGQPEPVEDTFTVQDFFVEYENLFNEIPLNGEDNSHEYLVKTSGALLEFDKDTEDIQPLLDEISQLRQQLLEANQEIIELQQPDV